MHAHEPHDEQTGSITTVHSGLKELIMQFMLHHLTWISMHHKTRSEDRALH